MSTWSGGSVECLVTAVLMESLCLCAELMAAYVILARAESRECRQVFILSAHFLDSGILSQ